MNGFRYEPPQAFGGVVVAGDQSSGYSEWVGIEPSSGQVLWRSRPGREFGFAVAGAGDLVFVTRGSPNDLTFELAALDVASGASRWELPLGRPRTGVALAAQEGRVFVTGWEDELRALDAGSGAQLWSRTIDAHSPETLQVAQNLLLVAASVPENGVRASKMLALSASDGQDLWQVEMPSSELLLLPSLPYPGIGAGRLFVPLSTTSVRALDVTTRQELWTRTLTDLPSRVPYIAIVSASDGGLYTSASDVVQRRGPDGRTIWSTKLRTASGRLVPTPGDSLLIVTTNGKPPPYRD